MNAYVASGTHWLVDCHGVAADLLADGPRLEAMLCDAAADAGAHRLFQHFHRFGDGPGSGVTGVVLLAESHITIHTWPDQGFAAIDLFLCGDTRPALALQRIEQALLPQRIVTVRQARGDAATSGRQRPLKTAGRFSRKAVTPSRKSG